MTIQKDIEILSLALKEADRTMPIDLKDSLTHAILALRFADVFREAFFLFTTAPKHTDPRQPGQAAGAARSITTE